ncbi:Hypothetical predicted protein [Marmota monax]|uniref:Carboxylesterase type B domain-containing protein n=1 Tax=Marmota monax TaxID=9995 RepID=A0A5E4A498_MARMO|nr:hypothetical protein GHT09_000584 [Marmota monax]VTJ52103.1 Hypothetical predicted protein [Marmota monax]
MQIIAEACGSNASDSQALLKCLRAKSPEELLNLSQKAKHFTRVVDGKFFPEDPLDLLIRKTYKAIPSIIGVNNHECGFLLPMVRILAVLPVATSAVAGISIDDTQCYEGYSPSPCTW